MTLLAALLVVSTLIIIPGAAYGAEADDSGTTTTVAEEAPPAQEAPPVTGTTTTVAEEPVPAEEAPPVTETTTTTSMVPAQVTAEEEPVLVTESTTTTSMVPAQVTAEEEPVLVTESTTTTSMVEDTTTTTTLPDESLIDMGPPLSTRSASLFAVDNPPLQDSCGLNIALVFDRSNSIDNATEGQSMRDAGVAFVNALQGTPSVIGVTTFAGIDGAGNNGIGVVNQPMTSVGTTAGANAVNATINGLTFGGLGDQGGTNWEDGFLVPHGLSPDPDVIIFLTDGNPTTYNGSSDIGYDADPIDVDKGAAQADIWKTAGTRIIAVGIDGGGAPNVSNLIAISGPTENSDYFTTNFADLGSNLGELALAGCSSTVTITKHVDPENDGTYVVSDGSPDWTFEGDVTLDTGILTWNQPTGTNPVSDLTGPDGLVLFDWDSDDTAALAAATFTETLSTGWIYDSATTCLMKTPEFPNGQALTVTEGTNAFSIGGIPVDGVVTCDVYNTMVMPSIQLTKSVSPSSVSSPQTVNYSFVVLNSGNVELTNVTLDDPLLTDEAIDWTTSTDPGTTDGTLSPGELVNGTGTYTITQAMIDSGSDINNTATASSTESPDATDSATVTITQAPGLEILKTGTLKDGGDGVDANDTITYTFKVTNSGNTTLSNITVDDQAYGVVISGGPIALAPGAFDDSTFTGVYTITQADIDAGTYTNCATATTGNVTSVEDCDTRTLPQTPAITLIKDGTIDLTTPPDATVGDLISYTFTITNTGNTTLTGVTLDDPLLTDEAIDWLTSTEPLQPVGTLSPGSTVTGTGTHTVTLDDINDGSFTNTATATGTPPIGPDVSDDDTHIVIAPQDDELTLTKTADPTTVSATGTVTYSFTITNTGNTTLTNIVLVDDTADTITGSPIASLAPGASSNAITATYTVTQADLDAGTAIVNTATATSDEGATDTASATVTIIRSPGMTILKDGVFQDENQDGFAQVDETIDYTFTVTNTGNVTLTGVTITDANVTVIGGPTTLDVNEVDTTTFSATYIITQDDIDVGSFQNCAVATDGTTESPESCTTDDLPQLPSIGLTKDGVLDMTVVPPTDRADELDVINYGFTITNTGNVTLTGVWLNDPQDSTASCDWSTASLGSFASDLLPTETVECTASYEITQGDINAGVHNNTATATGTPPTGGEVSDDATATVPIVQEPSIRLTKTVTPTVVSTTGPVTYSFEVTNTGNITLTSNTLTDLLPGVVITQSVIPSLAPGATNLLGFTASYTVTQADIDAGLDIINTATVNAAQGVSDVDQAVVEITQEPGLGILKQGMFNDENGDNIAQVDETISYTFNVANTGNVTLTGITIDDPVAGVDVTGGPISLAPQATDNTTFKGTYTITQADIDAGSFENCATATDGTVVSNVSCVTVELPQSASIDLQKTGTIPGGSDVGDPITYAFTVTNTGNVTLDNITLADTIGGVTILPPGGVITTLAPGASDNSTFTGIYNIKQSDIDAGTFTNTATATGFDPNGTPVSDPDDDTQTFTQNPLIDLVKTGTLDDTNGDGVDSAGDIVNYTFTVTNTGNVTLTDVIVTDPLVTVAGSAIPTMAPGAIDTTTFTASYVLLQSDIDAGTFTNTATVTGTDPNAADVTDTDDDVQTFDQDYTLTLVKSADPTVMSGPGTVTYSFTVTNTGNTTLTNIVLDDDTADAGSITGSPIATLAPGASDSSITATYTVTQTDIDAGTDIVNIATATSDEGATDTDTATVTITHTPLIDLVKTGTLDDTNGDGVDSAGDIITYVFTVTNTGNTTLTDVIVTDPLVTVVGSAIPTMAPGAVDSTTFTASYVLTQTDIDAGTFTNTATVTGTDSVDGPITDTDDDVQMFDQDYTLTLVKSADPTVMSGPGTVTYSFTVTNTGNTTLTNIVLDDDTADAGSITGSPIATLAPGASDSSITATYTVTQTDIDAGTDIVNIATATSDEGATDTDTATVTITRTPALTLVKSADPTVMSGPGTVTYSFTVTNTGNTTLTNIVLDDDTADAGSITGSPIATLAPGASDSSITATYTVTQTDIDAGTDIVNIATATSDEGATDTDTATVTITRTPALTLVKSADPTVMSGPGTVTYSFTVTNTGNTTLTNIVLDDDTADAGSITGSPIATLAPGASDSSITATYTVTQTDIDAGTDIVNIATATSDEGATDTDTATVTITHTPLIDLVKTGVLNDGGDGVADAGDIVNYTFTVTNTGNTTLTDVIVTDPLVTVIGSALPTMAPGAVDSTTFTASYVLTQTDIDAGTFTNTATVTGTDSVDGPITDTDDDVQTFDQDYTLTLVKSADPTVMSGPGTVTYSFTVTNTGNTTLTNIVLDDDTADAGSITGSPIATLAPGASDSSITATYTVTQTDIDAGTDIVNIATATSDEGATDTDTATVTITRTPALTLVKSADPTVMSGPGTVTYSFTVTNTGNTTLTNIVLDDDTADAGSITGSPIATLAPGASDSSITATYTVTQTDIDAGTDIVNIATATSDEGATDTDTATVTITHTPLIDLVKTGSIPGGDDAGDLITYTFTVTNTGNVTLTNITLADTVGGVTILPPGGSIATLAPSASDNTTFSGEYTITQDDVDAGTFTNTAEVTGTPTTGGLVTDTDDDVQTFASAPSIDVTKTGAFRAGSTNHAGDVIDYDFTITNTGDVTLTAVGITDPILDAPAVCTWPGSLGSLEFELEPTESVDCTGSYTTVQADVDAGGVDNTVTATGTPPTGGPVTDTADETVPIQPLPTMTLFKDGVFNDEDGDGFAQPGETISYTFTVSNEGNVTLRNITIDDPKVTVDGGPILSLAPGASDSTTFTATYTITQDDVNAGEFENCATAFGDIAFSNESCTTDELPQNPSIDLVKTGALDDTNGDGVDSAGDTINYTFKVTNDGNVTLTLVDVYDTIGGVTINGFTILLEPQESDTLTYTGFYVVTQGDIDAGWFTNTATTSGLPLVGPPVNDTDDDIQTFTAEPGLELVKDGTFNDEDQDGFAQPGETITYTFTVENTGNVTLTDVTITDPKVTVLGGPIGTLLPGAIDNTTFSATYTITQDDVDAGTFENCATPSADDPNEASVGGAEDCTTDDLPQNPLIDLIKTGVLDDTNGDGVDSAGDTVTYSFTVENTGNVTLTDVTVTDPLVSVVGGPIATMAPGAVDSTTFTATYVLTQGDIDAGTFTNTATTTGTDPNDSPVTDTDDDIQNFTAEPGLELVKDGTFNDEDQDGFAQPGETITYTFTVENTGNVTLIEVTITDPKVTVIGGPIGTLLPGAIDNTTFSATYIITQDDVDAGTFENCATPNALDPNEDPVEGAEDCTTDDLPQNPLIDLVKTGTLDDGGDGVADAGDTVDYEFTVTNTGNVTLTNVTLADTVGGVIISGGPIATMAPNDSDSTTFTGEYTLTQDDIDAGTFTNTATATGTDPNDSPVTDTDDDTQTFDAAPGLVLTKSGTVIDGGDGVDAGDTITYTFTVENTGNVTLTDVDITEDVAGVTVTGGPIAVMLPGDLDTLTFTGEYTITQADIDAGTFQNCATPEGLTPVEETFTGTQGCTDNTLDQTPDIALIKTGTLDDTNGDGMDSAGDIVSYAFTVTNTGNVTLTNVTLADTVGGVSIVGGPIATMAPNDSDSTTFTGSYTLTQDDIDAGGFYNIATVTGTDPNDDPVESSDGDTQTFELEPGLVLTKSGTVVDGGDGVDAGDTITYTFTVENTGNVTLYEVDVTEDVAGVSVTGGPIGSLAPGATDTDTFTGVYTITQADIDAGEFENCATPEALGPEEEPFIGTQGCTTDDLPQTPLIDLVKTGTLDDTNSDGVDSAGDTINYDFVITNDGNVTLTGVVLDDPRLDAPAVCDWANSSDPLTGVGTLSPGETVDCTGVHVTDQSDIDAGFRNNRATATGTPPIGDEVIDEDTETITFEQLPSIDVIKTGTFEDEGGDGFAQPGETITYTFAVENTGNVTLTDVTLADTIGGVTITGGPIGTLLPGVVDSTTFTGSYTLTQADVDAGTFHNEALVTATPPGENPDVTDDDYEDTPLPQNPGIGLFKNGAIEVGADGRVDVGDPIVYTFTIENTGNVTLYSPALTDLTFGDLDVSCVWDDNTSFALGVGFVNRVNCTATYYVTQEDIDAGEVYNCAVIEATGPGEEQGVSAESCVTLDEPQEPGIEVVKTALTPEINESESVTFEIAVTNTGNVTLHDVEVTDELAPGCERTFGAILVPGETVTYECTVDSVDASFTNVAVAKGTPPILSEEEPPQPIESSDDAAVVALSPEFVVDAGVCLTDDVGGVQLDRPYLVWDTKNWPEGAVLNIRIFDKDMNLYSEGTVVNAMDTMFWPGYDDSGFDPATGIGGIIYPPEELRPIYIQIYTNPETPVTLVEYPPATDGCTPNPAIDVVKTADPDPITVGEATEVTWTITVTNTGDSLLQDVELIDEETPGCNLVIGNLDAGESVEQTCTATYTADAADWTFDNMAFATGIGLWGTEVDDDDVATVTAIAPNSIGDTVFNDANENGVQDAGEKGIAGALVTLTLPGGTTLNTTTDANGLYLFSDLGVGEYTVEVVMSSIPKPSDGDLKLTTAGSYTIQLEAGDVFLDADFGVVAVLPVTGIDTTSIALIALALLLAGAAAVFLTTRKRKDDEGGIAA